MAFRKITLAATALAVCSIPAGVLAQSEDSPSPSVHRLAPETIDAIRAENAETGAEQVLLPLEEDGLPVPRIQSQISFGIGTGGYRELSGSTLIPLGNDGFVALGLSHVEDNRFRDYRYRRYRGGPAY